MVRFILQILLFFLPLHGLITVFGFDGIRYWKEFLIIVLLILWLGAEVGAWFKRKFIRFTGMEYLSIFFLGWLAFLVIINSDIPSAIIAVRYLGLGFLIYFVLSRLRGFGEISREDIRPLSEAFVIGVVFSIMFGVWAHYFGGFEVLQNWYSNTISSWVPGQTIPLYHEVGNMIRMQGGSSGPVVFAHMCFLAVVLLSQTRFSKSIKILLWILLVFGIVLSLTRAVWMGLLIYYLVFWVQSQKPSAKQIVGVSLLLIFVSVSIVVVPSARAVVFRKESTHEHITKPIEVLKIGLENPQIGVLGEVGPAARIKNLETINNDKAPVAENVFIDYFAQTGIIGLIISLLFFLGLLRYPLSLEFRLSIALIFMASVASIFDMASLSIAFFICLSVLRDSTVRV